MASSLLALLDDITAILDDVAILSKVAVKKTGGVIGDDIALNAEQVTGFSADRELPVIWEVAKGSLINKVILVPAALLISAFVPVLLVPLLMFGGLFLCFEGVEKILHKYLHKEEDAAHKALLTAALVHPEVDFVTVERDRIKGAIRTDFILSAEIIVIALGTMATAPMMQQTIALSILALGVTVLVYGLVAGVVKLDDLGLRLHRIEGSDAAARASRAFGAWILRAAPWLMRTLSVVGTAAMFMVGGSILVHGIAPVDQLVGDWSATVREVSGFLGGIVRIMLDAIFGIIAGAVAVAVVTLGKRVVRRTPSDPAPLPG